MAQETMGFNEYQQNLEANVKMCNFVKYVFI